MDEVVQDPEDSDDRLYLTQYSPTHRPWRAMYSCPERLFRPPAHRSESMEGEAAENSPFIRVCFEFPELLAGWPGLLLRHLPVKHIVRLSHTASCFRHLGQDPEVFKLLCAIAWPGCRRSEAQSYGGSWRNMYCSRPRLRTDGIYVVKWSTARFGTDEGHGTKEAGKNYYKPVIISCMYRVFLFLPGGRVASLTTNRNATPTEALMKQLRRALRHRTLLGASSDAAPSGGGLAALPRFSHQGVSVGRYVQEGEKVDATWSFVPETHPKMNPILIRMQMLLASSRQGANDVLEVVRHGTGSAEEGAGYLLQLPPRPYSFIALDKGTGKRLEALEGWPECYIGDQDPEA